MHGRGTRSDWIALGHALTLEVVAVFEKRPVPRVIGAARALELTLTSRSKDASGGIPMCGVPHHAAEAYIARLVKKGFRVAICEQVEDPKKAKGIVKREVVRVVSPGTLTDANFLDAREPAFMIAIAPANGHGAVMGVALLDLSTGEFSAAEYAGADGMKTGFTNRAQHTLVASATRDGRTLIAVLLGAITSGWQEASALLDAGFRTRPAAGAPTLPEPAISPYAVRAARRSGFVARSASALFLPPRLRSRCAARARSNPGRSTAMPLSAASSTVRSMGKPYVSCSLNAIAPSSRGASTPAPHGSRRRRSRRRRAGS